MMIHQLRSRAIQRLRFLGVAPLLGVLLLLLSCEQTITQELLHQSLLPKGAYLFTKLIGSWTTTERTMIADLDGHSSPSFPKRGDEVRACLSRLVLGADGRFQMSDERTKQIVQGTWESDSVGVSVQLHYIDPASSRQSPAPILYHRDGSIATPPFPKTILLAVTSLNKGTFEAWQAYDTTEQLSGSQVHYHYRKE